MTNRQIISKAIQVASYLYGLKQEDICNGSHTPVYTQCRACIYYAVRVATNLEISYDEIYLHIPRTRSTMINGLYKIRKAQKKKHVSESDEKLVANAEITLTLVRKYINAR